MTERRLDHAVMPAYLDKEVTSEGQDKFGHAHLAAALRDLIEDGRHRPPYSVGLLGKWGTGKSTVKGLYLDGLDNDERKNGQRAKRRDRIYPVTFNAWKYAGESEIRKSLFRHIFLQIGGTHDEADRNLFKTVASTEYRKKSINEVWTEFVDHYAVGLAIVGLFVLLFAVLVAMLVWMASLFGVHNTLTSLGSVVTSGGVISWLAQKFFSNLPILSARTPVQITSPPSQTIDEFENLFLAQLAKFKKTTDGKRVRRIVVFIDDLDRLTADEMVSGLDGIRSLSEMASHKMPDDIGIVFVISCDEERVADALSKRRTAAELPAAVSNIQDARRYLDRIFQFRLEIPPFPKQDMRNFACGLLETEYPALAADLKARGTDLQELVDRMIHPGVQSPRNAIQIVNLFAQSWWLAVLRELGAVGADTPGGLGEGVVTKNPLTLAIICVIRTDFPDFYQALQKNPRIFGYFIDRFVRPEPLESLPRGVREQLTAFASDKSIESDKQERWDIRPQHRGLRQFMSYVQDVRRPYSLQPLLTLSQDPVSRRHGDKAVPIEEALRTADVVGLLEAVGLTGSSGTFPADFGAMLADLIDDLRTETPTIQDNVAFTVAQLDQRIPEKDKRRVLGLAVRRAGDSGALRWRLGPTKLHDLAPYADSDELRALGRALIEDITADPANIRLPSQEYPSLPEGLNLAQTAAELVVYAMQDADLPPHAQVLFGGWLLTRTVKIAKQSTQMPLSWLENQLAAHEAILLPLIRDEYPRIVAEEFSRAQPEALDVSAVTTRLDALFEHFFKQGTQTRARLWSYLKEFTGLPQPAFVTLVFKKFAAWHDHADTAAANSIFAAMGARLAEYEADAAPLDDDEPALREIFTGIAEVRTSFDSESVGHMSALGGEWSKSPERAASAARIYDVLAKADPARQTALGQDWAKRFFTNLPAACQQAILHTAGRTDAPLETRTAIASAIAGLRGAKALNDHQIDAFSRLFSILDPATLHSTPFAEQVNQLIDDTVNLVTQNPAEYLVSKTRAFGGSLNKLPPEKAQQLLNSFAQLQPQPQILAAVYGEMSEVWPVPAAEGGLDYAAQQLFNAGTGACAQLGQAAEAVQLLKSLDRLHRHARLHQADNQDRLVADAYHLWSHAPAESEEVFRSYPEAKRSPEQLVELVQAAATAEQDESAKPDKILAALVHEVGVAGAEAVRDATVNLLARPPAKTDGLVDPVLALWAKAVTEHDPTPFVDILVDSQINDEQAVRLYHRILDSLQTLSIAQFIAVLKQTLPVPDGRDKMADVLVRSLPDVAAQIFASDEKRRLLCEGVLSVFADVPKRERKAELAKACTPLGLKDVVVDGGFADSMSADDIEIIERFTGKIR